jgi:predicted phage terminase large subunit-like protein
MIVRYWDQAGTEGDGAYTAGVLIGKHRDTGDFWVLDVVRGQWGTARREARIKQTTQMDGRGVRVGIEQEPGSGGKESAENTIRNLAGYRVKAFAVGQSDGNKVARADPFSVQVNAGNVKLVENEEWNSEFIRELRLFPRWKFKDQVDAAGGGFNMITKRRVRVGGFRGTTTERSRR